MKFHLFTPHYTVLKLSTLQTLKDEDICCKQTKLKKGKILEEIEVALEEAHLYIRKYDPDKARPIYMRDGTTVSIKKLSTDLISGLGTNITKYPKVFKAVHDPEEMEDLLSIFKVDDLMGDIEIPQELKRYTLNANKAARRGEDEFFLSTEDEFMSRTSGKYYINRCGIPIPTAYAIARGVIPDYRPRNGPGVFQEMNGQTKEVEDIFNSYIPPEWFLWKKDNPKLWKALPEKPPALLMKLLKHLLPLPEERKYFYAWLYTSLTTRSYVYLVLSGAPGSGKNRLKLIMRALHGKENIADGKKSTIVERFNSQLAEGTLAWFDELKYDSDMENVMKEMQNDYFSIERKGVDATRSSTIYSSMVISNNKPRDNFIAFDARKFAPLVLADKDLRYGMTEDEIDLLTKKVELNKPDFDVKFVAQIAKWIMRVGKKYHKNYPNLEYKGPMFWTLAHTSMTRWQKKAVTLITEQKPNARVGWNPNEKAYLWSALEEKYKKRNGHDKSMQFPDYSSVRAFFDVFRNGQGQKAFATKPVLGDNILGDFWILPLVKEIEVITEATVAQQREKGRSDGKKTYDL